MALPFLQKPCTLDFPRFFGARHPPAKVDSTALCLPCHCRDCLTASLRRRTTAKDTNMVFEMTGSPGSWKQHGWRKGLLVTALLVRAEYLTGSVTGVPNDFLAFPVWILVFWSVALLVD